MEGDPLPLYAGIERILVARSFRAALPFADRLGEGAGVHFTAGWGLCSYSVLEESMPQLRITLLLTSARRLPLGMNLL